jgi:hypothetical protein
MKTPPFPQNPSPKTQELPVNKPGAEPAERVVAMSMLSEAEIELLISALYTLEDAHCRLADRAEGLKEQAKARTETARRCLTLAEKLATLLPWEEE